jgi:hypothetical protein
MDDEDVETTYIWHLLLPICLGWNVPEMCGCQSQSELIISVLRQVLRYQCYNIKNSPNLGGTSASGVGSPSDLVNGDLGFCSNNLIMILSTKMLKVKRLKVLE